MANIKNTYTGDGSTVLFSFTFPYISIQDIVVSVDEVIQDRPTEYQLANATTIEFTTAPADGSDILIYRSTQQEDLKAVFYPGSAIRASDLNDNFTQTLYISQESSDKANESEITAEEAIQASKDAQAAAEASAESADEAAASAAQASQDASQANSKADDAVATANSADAKADQAISTANAAETKADAAVVTADDAEDDRRRSLMLTGTLAVMTFTTQVVMSLLDCQVNVRSLLTRMAHRSLTMNWVLV